MGFGALILFIATAVTAAIAAVLITTTTNSASSQAAATAQGSVSQAAAALIPIGLSAVNVNTTTQTANRFLLTVALAPGSPAVLLNGSILEYLNPLGGREVFTYGGNVSNASATLAAGRFYISIADSYSTSQLLFGPSGVVSPGDIAGIVFQVNTSLRPNQQISVRLIAPGVQPMSLTVQAPSALIYNTVVLYG